MKFINASLKRKIYLFLPNPGGANLVDDLEALIKHWNTNGSLASIFTFFRVVVLGLPSTKGPPTLGFASSLNLFSLSKERKIMSNHAHAIENL